MTALFIHAPLEFSVGQPLLVTANDYDVGLFNGDTGVVVDGGPLGLRAIATDLNPVAVLINKAMIEIPPKFAGRPPVNLAARQDRGQGNPLQTSRLRPDRLQSNRLPPNRLKPG